MWGGILLSFLFFEVKCDFQKLRFLLFKTHILEVIETILESIPFGCKLRLKSISNFTIPFFAVKRVLKTRKLKGTKPRNSRNPKGMKNKKNEISKNPSGVTLKKLEIFHTIQKQYAILGIRSSNLPTQQYPLNERILLIFMFFECVTVSQFTYTFRSSNGFVEYMESICTSAGSAVIFVCLAAVVFRQTTLFNVIDNLQKFIDTSKTVGTNLNVISFGDCKCKYFRMWTSRLKSVLLKN